MSLPPKAKERVRERSLWKLASPRLGSTGCWFGDEQHTGMLEYYKQAVAGGRFLSDPVASQRRVLMKSPQHVTTLVTITGRSVNVNDSGLFDLEEVEAKPLIANGWVEATAQ
jgi:hypothetical protein